MEEGKSPRKDKNSKYKKASMGDIKVDSSKVRHFG